jgi:hypothetical protein
MAQFTKKKQRLEKFENSKVPYHITDISFQIPATGLWKLKGHQTWVASTHARFFLYHTVRNAERKQGTNNAKRNLNNRWAMRQVQLQLKASLFQLQGRNFIRGSGWKIISRMRPENRSASSVQLFWQPPSSNSISQPQQENIPRGATISLKNTYLEFKNLGEKIFKSKSSRQTKNLLLQHDYSITANM